jgi:hypothetical protein
LRKITNLSHHNPHLMRLVIIHKRNQAVKQRISIQQNLQDTTIDIVRVLHTDHVIGGSKAVIYFKSRPILWDTRVDINHFAYF